MKIRRGRRYELLILLISFLLCGCSTDFEELPVIAAHYTCEHIDYSTEYVLTNDKIFEIHRCLKCGVEDLTKETTKISMIFNKVFYSKNNISATIEEVSIRPDGLYMSILINNGSNKDVGAFLSKILIDGYTLDYNDLITFSVHKKSSLSQYVYIGSLYHDYNLEDIIIYGNNLISFTLRLFDNENNTIVGDTFKFNFREREKVEWQ